MATAAPTAQLLPLLVLVTLFFCCHCGSHQSGWIEAFDSTDDPVEMECLEYLHKYAPPSDLNSPNISKDFLLTNVRLALAARNATSWGRAVPFPVFLNDVLPYAVLSEPRGLPDWDWRTKFYNTFMPQVINMPNGSIAAEQGINTLSWQIDTPPIKFVASPNCEINAYSPTQSMQLGYSSCTGLAVFVVLALRSVGLPARVAGVPHWNRCGGMGKSCDACPHGDLCTPGDHSSDDACGNHDWAEVYVEGGWHYIDPDGSKQLDDGWFSGVTKLQVPHTGSYLNHSILASSWAPSSVLASAPSTRRFYVADGSTQVSHFPMVWDWNNLNVMGFDVTPRYLMNS